MRYRQVLNEYVREKTITNFADALYYKIKRDPSASFWATILGNSRKGGTEGMSVTQWAKIEACRLFLRYCEEADPTPTNSYVVWIVKRYISGGIACLEDIRSTLADYLDEYDEIKKSGFFKRTTNEMLKPLADINRIKSLFELRAFLNSVTPAERMSNTAADKKMEHDLITSGQAELLVDTPACRIVIPHTEAAAIYFGRNTQWCTSAKRNNMFQKYNVDGPLFIVLDKASNKRWQFHPSTEQFMDENDLQLDRIDWDKLPREAKEPHQRYVEAVKLASRGDLNRMASSGLQPFNRMASARLSVLNYQQ